MDLISTQRDSFAASTRYHGDCGAVDLTIDKDRKSALVSGEYGTYYINLGSHG